MEDWHCTLEGVAVTDGWSGRTVLVTGHTGFKGAWLVTWLDLLGAEVTGLALPAEEQSLWALIQSHVEIVEVLGDVRDAAVVAAAFDRSEPEVVIHLAAQSLVRRGYREPLETFDVNLRGTALVLEAALRQPSVRAVVVVTSDKVYDAQNQQPYTESSTLGGTEPYGASKACTEILVNAYRESFFRPRGIPVATARAGNVIGGGDRAADRLVPDVVRMLECGRPVSLRYPDATRPWQHVLDPLRGYLMLAERMLIAPNDAPQALNFGPPTANCVASREVVERLSSMWGGAPGWLMDDSESPPEAPALTLSSDLAAELLGWRSVLHLNEALEWTARWYDAQRRGAGVKETTEQIERFQELVG